MSHRFDGSVPPRTAAGTSEAAAYLADLGDSYPLGHLEQVVNSLADARVLVVGDLIMDEYCYCRVSGTVSKWPVIAAVYQDLRRMAGGGAAIARHVRQFAQSVQYVSTVGDRDDGPAYAEPLLERDGIDVRFFTWPGTYTVAKRRYITGGYPNPLAPALQVQDARNNTRLFEIGFMPQEPLPIPLEETICAYLQEVGPRYDAVILADFGHGLISPRVASTLAASARWWAVNAQTNSSNYGFNRITKYRGADFVCIDELEARIPSGQRREPLESVVAALRDELACRSIMVTRGRDGLLLFDGAVTSAPALASTALDPLGAGDAVLALASLCRWRGVDERLTAFLGACAGALASQIVGNDEPIRRAQLLDYVRTVLSPMPDQLASGHPTL